MSLNNSILSKFNDICRTCLKGGELLTYLYDEENSINIVKKLITCTTLQFDKNDQMPNKICPTCIEELLQAFNFINKCQISDATLKKYMINESAIKVEDNLPEIIDQQQQIKLECEAIDQTDPVSDISIKDEFSEQLQLHSIDENVKKRKYDEMDCIECSVNLSCKKIATNTDNVRRNQTFSVPSSPDKTEKVARRAHSDYGKENLGVQSKKTKKKPYACPVCPKVLYSTVSLLKHMQSHIEADTTEFPKTLVDNIPEQATSYSCQICRHICEKPLDLIEHYSQHLKVRRCDFCNKICYNKPQLQKHIRLNHYGSLPFKCEKCSKKFPNLKMKQLHVKQHHSDEKQHKCAICFYTFDTLNQLDSHGMEHVGDAPHSCENCFDVFTDANSFIRHKVIEKCGRFYNCIDCSKVYQSVKDRKLHRLKDH